MTAEILTAADAQRYVSRIAGDDDRVSDALAVATSLTERKVNYDVIDREVELRLPPPSSADSDLLLRIPRAYEVVLGDIGAWPLRQALISAATSLVSRPGDINAGQVSQAAQTALNSLTGAGDDGSAPVFAVAGLIAVANDLIERLTAANPDLIDIGVVTAERSALQNLTRFRPSRFYPVPDGPRLSLKLKAPVAGWDPSLLSAEDGFIVYRAVVGLTAEDLAARPEIKRICGILLTHFYADPAAVDSGTYPDMVNILASRVWR